MRKRTRSLAICIAILIAACAPQDDRVESEPSDSTAVHADLVGAVDDASTGRATPVDTFAPLAVPTATPPAPPAPPAPPDSGGIDLPDPLYYYAGRIRPLVWAIGWPGADDGAIPALSTRLVLDEGGRCERTIDIAGAADSSALGPQLVPLVPVAAVSAGDTAAPPPPVFSLAFPEGQCPGNRPALIRGVGEDWRELESVLLSALSDTLARATGVELAPMQALTGQLWRLADDRRLYWGKVGGEHVGKRGQLLHGFSGVELTGLEVPRVVFLQTTGRYRHWNPLSFVDVDGREGPEVVATTWDQGPDPETVGMVFLRANVDGTWRVWKRVDLYYIYPVGD